MPKSTILITGASRGIGAAIAMRLARDGHRLALCYRAGREAAEAVALAAEEAGAETRLFQADLSDRRTTSDLPGRVSAAFGGLDAVVANAGLTEDGPFLTLKHEQIESVIRTNLSGTMRLACAALPFLEKSTHPSIVLMASLGGIYGTDGQVPYSASKGGIIGLAQWLGELLAAKGIRVNAIAPGFVETDMTTQLREERVRPFLEFSALKRTGTPDEIAHIVGFLLNPGYIQSTTIRCDGGFGR